MAVDAELGPQIEAIISKLVGTGRFESEADVLREGVRLVQERENRLAALDAAIEEGVASVKAGRTKPVDEVFDRLEAKYRAIAVAQRVGLDAAISLGIAEADAGETIPAEEVFADLKRRYTAPI
jgi:antitoxin ParD1/3/4